MTDPYKKEIQWKSDLSDSYPTQILQTLYKSQEVSGEDSMLMSEAPYDFIADQPQRIYTCVKCKKKFNRMLMDKGRICPKCSNNIETEDK